MKYLKQSTAAVIPFGPALLPADGVTLVTSLVSALDHASTGIFLCKNGTAAAIRHATVTATTYDAYGSYLVTLDTTDTATLGRLRVMFAAAANTLPIWEDFTILPANVYDSLVGGSANLKVDLDTIKTQAVTAAAGVTVLASVGTAATSTAQTGDGFARLGAPAGASHSADVAAVKVDTAAVKVQTDKLTFTVANQVDSNVLDWKSATAPAMTGDAFARVGAAGAGLTALGDTRIANLDATMSSRTKPADTQAAVTLVTTTTNLTTNNDKTGYGLSAAAVQAIWDALTSALTTVGSIGKRIVDFLTGDAYIRLGAPAGASVSADVAAVKVDTAAVKVQTDKLTFTVANQIDANVLDWKSATAPAMTGDAFARVGAAGAGLTALGDTRIANLDATISSRTKPADTQAAVTLVATTTNLTTNNDKTGYGLSAAAVQAIWDALTSALTTVGSIGKWLLDKIDVVLSTRSTYAGGAVASVTAGVTVTTNNDKTGYALTAGQLSVKRNTSLTITFPMTDSTTHAPKPGVTVTAQRSIDGAALVACANAPAAISGGLYSLVLAAADLDGAMITVVLSGTAADTRFLGLVTQA